MATKKKAAERKVARSAKTGKLVSKDFAKKHPKTTTVEKVSRPKFKKKPIPKALAAAADLFYETQRARLALQKELEPMKEFEAELREHIIKQLPKSQAGGISGRLVRVERREKEIPQVKDAKKFEAFARKKGNEDLMVSRPNTKAIEDRWENGKKIPGVVSFKAITLSVHALK